MKSIAFILLLSALAQGAVPIPTNAVRVTTDAQLVAALQSTPKGTSINATGVEHVGSQLVITDRTVYGVWVHDVHNYLQGQNAAVILGSGGLYDSHIGPNIDGQGVCLFGVNSKCIANEIDHCGHNGVGGVSNNYNPVNGGPNPNTDCVAAEIAFNYVHDINTGLSNPVWVGHYDNKTITHTGLGWQVIPGWEAGGIDKIVGTKNAHVHHNIVKDVYGVGIWFDVYNDGGEVDHNEISGCHGVLAGWEGMGTSDEINWRTNQHDNYSHGNTGSAIQTAESASPRIHDNYFDNGIERRALSGRTPGASDVQVVNNTQGAPAIPLLVGPNAAGVYIPTTQPGGPPAILPAPINFKTASIAIVGGKVVIGGQADPVTNGATDITRINGTIYHKAHGNWYAMGNGFGDWSLIVTPALIAKLEDAIKTPNGLPPPTTQPDPVAQLQIQLKASQAETAAAQAQTAKLKAAGDDMVARWKVAQ